MNPTLAAVLARFDGNKHEAIAYCIRVGIEHPNFREEYDTIADMLAHPVGSID